MRPHPLPRVLCLLLLTAACDGGASGAGGGAQRPTDGGSSARSDGGSGGGGGGEGGAAEGAHISLNVTAPGTLSRRSYRAELVPGAARGPALSSLKYLIRDISLCETVETTGSGYNNPQRCISLYQGPLDGLVYDPRDDFTPLAAEARARTSGYVDLLDPASRAALSVTTALRPEHAHAYSYGIITWALPIKLTAEVSLADGSTLYTHDGVTTSQLVGSDNYRDYFTVPSTSLASGPAEEAVVLLPNGGNWFKLQTPLQISDADLAASRAITLDLVFNPDGIVKGYAGDRATGALRELGDGGVPLRGISVPMLDLAPVAHYADQRVVRESYQGPLLVGADAFDVRIEVYSVEGDPTRAVYGVDVKSLVNEGTTTVPPELFKASYAERAPDGSITLLSHSRQPIATLGYAAAVGDGAAASFACGEHSNRARVEGGGAAIVVERCPGDTVTATLTLRSRSTLSGAPVGGALDGGADDAGALDAGADDASAEDGATDDAAAPDAG
jgi:hypothetical protein